jgi:predicted lipoprotein with Yx(FWY)xxD motif
MLSATGKQGEQTYFPNKNLIQAPVTDGQGNVMSQTPDTMYGVNLDTGETFSAPAEGEWQIISDGEHAYTGDGTDLLKVKIPDGSVLERNTDALGGGTIDTAPFVKDGDTGYIAVSEGVARVELNTLETESLDLGPSPNSPNTMIVYDNGDKLLMNQQQELITYDIENETTENSINQISVDEVSAFEDDTLIGVSGGNLYAWDENLNQLASIDIDGPVNTPPIPFEEDDGTKMIYSLDSVTDGIISAYEFDGSSFIQQWQEDRGVGTGEITMYGDSILYSGSDGPGALNREDGSEIWSKNSEATLFGMPYDENVPAVNPVGDGFRVIDVETGQIGDAPAELVHNWDGIPSRMTVGGGATWHHVLEEVGGESPVTGVQVVYEIEAENGEPYQVVAPLELNPGQVMERDFNYNPIREEDGSFQGEFRTDINEVEVRHPVDITGGQTEVTLKATPEDGATSSERLL